MSLRSDAEKYREIRRRTREALRRRYAERLAAGLCVRCGLTKPLTADTRCQGCREIMRAANRASAARKRAE